MRGMYVNKYGVATKQPQVNTPQSNAESIVVNKFSMVKPSIIVMICCHMIEIRIILKSSFVTCSNNVTIHENMQ